jgi:hypothetical protein
VLFISAAASLCKRQQLFIIIDLWIDMDAARHRKRGLEHPRCPYQECVVPVYRFVTEERAPIDQAASHASITTTCSVAMYELAHQAICTLAVCGGDEGHAQLCTVYVAMMTGPAAGITAYKAGAKLKQDITDDI